MPPKAEALTPRSGSSFWLVVLARRSRESGNPAAYVMTLNFESSGVAIFAPSWILIMFN
jgi:hypothetical protein